jgi:hypothetical protein
MKKVLILFVSVVMVLSLAAVAFGAVNVSGELKCKYYFQGYNSEIGPTDEGKDCNDQFEAKLKFDGKVNDNLAYFVAAKAKAYDNDGAPDPVTDVISTKANNDFYLDEYWANYTAGFGSIKVGLFEVKPKGPIVDVIDGAYKNVKSATWIQYSNKFADAIDFAVAYTPDYYKSDETFYDNAYIVKVGYNTDMWGVEGNVVNVGNRPDVAGKKDAQIGKVVGYTVNAYVVPIENFTVYASIGTDQFEDPAQIVGLKYVYNRLTAMLEYDLDKDNGDYVDEYNENLWGVKVKYAAAHGVEYEFGKKLTENKTGSTEDMKSECYVSAKVAF